MSVGRSLWADRSMPERRTLTIVSLLTAVLEPIRFGLVAPEAFYVPSGQPGVGPCALIWPCMSFGFLDPGTTRARYRVAPHMHEFSSGRPPACLRHHHHHHYHQLVSDTVAFIDAQLLPKRSDEVEPTVTRQVGGRTPRARHAVRHERSGTSLLREKSAAVHVRATHRVHGIWAAHSSPTWFYGPR